MALGIPELATHINPTPMFDKGIYRVIGSKDAGGSQSSNVPVQYLVKIFNKNAGQNVVGILKNNLKLNMDANWDPANILGSLTSNSTILSTLFKSAQLGGIADPTKYGLSSKKIYSSSGYLKVGVDFRVVDWYGDGESTKSAFSMLSHVVPTNRDSLGIPGSAELITKIKNIWRKIVVEKGYGQEGKDAFNRVLDSVGVEGQIREGVVNVFETMAKTIKAAGAGAEALYTDQQFFVLASAPLPVTLQIGNYFEHNDMVIDGVDVDFSRECTNSGPLYADFSVNLSSRKSVLIDTDSSSNEPGIGLKSPNQTPRVIRDGRTSINTNSLFTNKRGV